MNENEFSDIHKILREVLQRITAVETKLDSYNGLREKLDKTYGITLANNEDIDEILGNRKWVMRTSVGALITSSAAIVVGLVYAALKFGDKI